MVSAAAVTQEMSTSPLGSGGVPTQTKMISDVFIAKATSVEKVRRPRPTLRATSSSSPGS